MKKYSHLFSLSLLLLLFASPLSYAMTGIFWQPQSRDNRITDAQWSQLMLSVKQQGIDTLIVQWTQYGDAFSDREQDTLLKRLRIANTAGLQLILGLNADPSFFSLQKQSNITLDHYLDQLKDRDIQQASRLSKELQGTFSAWYISAEIDDVNWRDPSRLSLMKTWLNSTKNELNKIDDKPVYISSFFSGNMSPDSYSTLISEIQNTGLNVWVQDGEGTQILTPKQREIYINKSAGCDTETPALGVVYELFNIKKPNSIKSRGDYEKLLNTASACEKERIFFSLRYLPISSNIMERG